VELVRRQLAGAKSRGEPAPSMLVRGPSGIGKTKFAKASAKEYGSSLILAHGSESAAELASKFRTVKAGDFLFIDEAHLLVPTAQELLYPVIDEHRLPSPSEPSAKAADSSAYIDIEPCTVVLATNEPGKLQNALRKRMELEIYLGYYSSREMKEIVDRLATELGLVVSPQSSNAIAKVSNGLPRDAKHLLQKLRRHMPDSQNRQLTLGDVRQFLRDWHIDAKGLHTADRSYLRFLLREGGASLASLASHLGTDQDDVMYEIEPRLRRLKFFKIDGKRMLTDAGRAWIERTEKVSR
jgi:Holliday junction DNA helicase RuvB